MMLAKIKNLTVIEYPYTFESLKKDNPYTNFGDNYDIKFLFTGTEVNQQGYELVDVIQSPKPPNDNFSKVVEDTPVFSNNIWQQVWSRIDLTQEEIQQKQIELSTNIRNQRNKLLNESDWTQLDDAPVDKQLWVTYRQQLRDITTQINFPWSIEWPVKP